MANEINVSTMADCKVLENLSAAVAVRKDFNEPRGVLQVVHAEPKPGVHVQIALGAGGLVIRRRDSKVGIPLAVLLQLAGDHCPEILGLPPRPSTINPEPSTN